MRRLAPLSAALIIAGCAATQRAPFRPPPMPARIPSISSHPLLKSRIDAMLPDSLFPPSNVAIRILSLTTGEVLYDLNAGLAFTPASNQKLFTSATALSLLGPAYEFTTKTLYDTTVPPTVYVVGSGDPVLSTADVDSLAGALAAALPAGRDWTLAGDVSRFDDLARGPGWTWDDEPDPTAMFLSPLSLNGNAIRVLVRPGSRQGDSTIVTTDPETRYVTIENSSVTAVDSPKSVLRISRKWREHSNTITVDGFMPPTDTLESEYVSIAGPEWYTLTVLRERLENRGIRCTGLILDSLAPEAVTVAGITHRLDSVLTYMNLESDNLSAENILKTLAAERFGPPGSTAVGSHLVAEFAARTGIDTTRVMIADGSGVSRYNLTSAVAVTDLLVAMADSERIFSAWERTLPIAGVSGTLKRRMRGTAAEGNLHAKTGTLQGVSSLSGYVMTADGERLAFSIIMQHFPNAARPYRDVQDKIGAYLAGLRRPRF
ncbi:MAG: D-alanyl-D-alanine carboxypeptidase/D-alanyl-D-alanine-endopeptidase [Bacteroidota bacterium]